MTNDPGGLDLTASLPAAQLAQMQRRMAFLEAVLVQVLRDERQMREWVTAGDLAALRLAGLPSTASGIARMARREGWESRIAQGRGGESVQYHFASLPRASFADFIDRVMRAHVADLAAPPQPVAARAAPPAASNATPQWVLPLLRLMRGGLALEDAVARLPANATSGRPRPAAAEARDVLRGLGLRVG